MPVAAACVCGVAKMWCPLLQRVCVVAKMWCLLLQRAHGVTETWSLLLQRVCVCVVLQYYFHKVSQLKQKEEKLRSETSTQKAKAEQLKKSTHLSLSDCTSVAHLFPCTHAPLVLVRNMHAQSSWRRVPTCYIWDTDCTSVTLHRACTLHSEQLKKSTHLLLSDCAPVTLPWYNHTGWLGVKHQLTYLLSPYLLSCAHRTTRCGGTCMLRAAEEKYPPVTVCCCHLTSYARTAPLVSSWRKIPTPPVTVCTSVTLPPIMHTHQSYMHRTCMFRCTLHTANNKLSVSVLTTLCVNTHVLTYCQACFCFVSSFCTYACTHTHITHTHIHAYVQHTHTHTLFLTPSLSVSFWMRPGVLCCTFICATVCLIVTELATV